MSRPVLSDAEVIAALSADDGPDWHLIAGKLIKTVVCDDFMAALAYVGEVGRLAEAADHHPDIDIRYNRVTLALGLAQPPAEPPGEKPPDIAQGRSVARRQ